MLMPKTAHLFYLLSLFNTIKVITTNRGECGPTQLLDLSGVITSPHYPENYLSNEFCEYNLNVGPDPNRKIIMNFTAFATEPCPQRVADKGKRVEISSHCDWVNVFDGNSTDAKLIGRFSGTREPFLIETDDTAIIQFSSNGNVQMKGFAMEYHTEYRGTWHITDALGIIESPNYPQNYPSYSNLTWIVDCPEHSACVLNFLDLTIADSNDYLEIYSDVVKNDSLSQKPTLRSRYTGGQVVSLPFSFSQQYRSDPGRIVVRFVTDGQHQAKGFKLVHQAIKSNNQGDCGQTFFTELEGELKSPNYPEPYKENTYCEYHINVGPDPNRFIVMDFLVFSTEECPVEGHDETCDWVKIYDGVSDDSKYLGRFSGSETSNTWPTIVETGDSAMVQFKSNNIHQSSGFQMKYHTKYQGNIVHVQTGQTNYQLPAYLVVSDEKGVIETPNYPHNYPAHSNLTWRIDCPKGSKCILNFLDFETADANDYLELYRDVEHYNGHIRSMTLDSQYSGAGQMNLPMSFSQESKIRPSSIVLKFVSDGHNGTRGFKLNYHIVKTNKQEQLVPVSGISMLITCKDTVVEIDRNRNSREFFGRAPHLISYAQELANLKLASDSSIEAENMTTLYRIMTNHQDYVVFDRLYELIFWIDMRSKVIKVKHIRRKSEHKVTDINPTALDLTMNLEKWKLIWSDIGNNPAITECNYDGTDKKIIYSNGRQSTHLTIDYQEKKYFFVDLTDYGLYSIDYLGESEEFYMSSIDLFGSLTGMGVLNNDIYLANKDRIYAVKDIQNRIELAEVLYKSHTFNKFQSKMPMSQDKEFYELDARVIRRPSFEKVLFSYDHVHHNLVNRCQSAKCDHLCLPIGDHTHRCLTP